MRLLQIHGGGNFSLVEYAGKNIPPYAILSHTWGADSEEVTFEDLRRNTGRDKCGFAKLIFCEQQAISNGLELFWVDTCCIDKSSSAELSEAINSMFTWYQKASECYVFLSDVEVQQPAVSQGNSFEARTPSYQRIWRSSFVKSRWFTRGWTLQELLAPQSVEFFSRDGKRLGNRISLLQEIHEATGISKQALRRSSLSQFSIDERMSWQERRKTKREEEVAYSLLGIFGVHMPPIYGEGQKHAFIRLHREIGRSSNIQFPHLSTMPFLEQHPSRQQTLLPAVPASLPSLAAERTEQHRYNVSENPFRPFPGMDRQNSCYVQPSVHLKQQYNDSADHKPEKPSRSTQFAAWTVRKHSNTWADAIPRPLELSSESIEGKIEDFEEQGYSAYHVLNDIPSLNARAVVERLVVDQNFALTDGGWGWQWRIASIELKWKDLNKKYHQLAEINIVLRMERL